MWNAETVREPYKEACRALESVVARSSIKQVFLSDQNVWGIPAKGGWRHFSVIPSEALIFKPSSLGTIEQIIAQKQQDYEMLRRGLAEFPLEILQQAYSLLTTRTLYRSEKCIEVAQWLLNLQERRQATLNLRI